MANFPFRTPLFPSRFPSPFLILFLLSGCQSKLSKTHFPLQLQPTQTTLHNLLQRQCQTLLSLFHNTHVRQFLILNYFPSRTLTHLSRSPSPKTNTYQHIQKPHSPRTCKTLLIIIPLNRSIERENIIASKERLWEIRNEYGNHSDFTNVNLT